MADFDVWRSRPLDVHRWSQHPQINSIVDTVFDSLNEDQKKAIQGRSNNAGRASGRDHLKVLLIDLFVAWKTDPGLCIGVARGNGAYSVNSRYNALHISSRMPKIIDILCDEGFLDFANGSYNRQGSKQGNRTSRIKAASKLVNLFKQSPADVFDIDLHHKQECIILTKDDTNESEKSIRKLEEYTDTPETQEMRDRLQHYNQFLAETFIDIPSFTDPWLVRKKTDGKTQHIPIGPTNKFVRRIFSRGSWDLNGRFYGGWWQQVDRHLRKEIVINNQPTVEVDYSGIHVAILSALRDKPANVGDRYRLKKHILQEFTEDEQRAIVKHLVLTAINARNEKTTYQAFRDDQPTGSRQKRLKDPELALFLEAFIEENQHLQDDLCSDQGIRLMNIDSQITDRIITSFTEHERAILSVHDSYIVETFDVDHLSRAMATASKEVVGQDLSFEQSSPSYGDVMRMGKTDRDRYFDTIKDTLSISHKTEEYEDRLARFIHYRKKNYQHTYWLG